MSRSSDEFAGLFAREPDVVYSERDALEDGALIDLRELGVVGVYFERRPITQMSEGLFDAFAAFNPGGPETEQAAAYKALLGLVTAGAYDTAGEGEPSGVVYESQARFHGLGCEPVWLTPNRDGWTAMLPRDY